MKTGLFILFILTMSIASAQQSFLVYQLKGNVKLKIGKQYSQLRIGQSVKSANTILLGKDAAVMLICEGYASFTINKAGNHLLKDYVDSCIRETNSVTSKYFKYIWDELTHPHSTPESNRRKYMQNTGAVVRGCPGIKVDQVFDTINNHNGQVTIKWKTDLPNAQLSFVLYDNEKEGRLLHSSYMDKNYVLLDTIKKYAGNNEEIYWNLAINGNEVCSRKYIKLWQTGDYTDLLAHLNAATGTILDKAERYYAIGFLLESQHFLAEAKEYYKKASTLKPTEKRYRQALNDF